MSLVVSSVIHKLIEEPRVECTGVFKVIVPGAQASARAVVLVHSYSPVIIGE